MAESNRVNHVLKSIREEAFILLVLQLPTSVAPMLTRCQAFEEARKRRILLITGITAHHDQFSLPIGESLPHPTRDVVREEVARYFDNPPSVLLPPSSNDIGLRKLIRDELERATSVNIVPAQVLADSDIFGRLTPTGSSSAPISSPRVVTAFFQPQPCSL